MPKDWHAAERWLQATQPDRWDPKREQSGVTGAFAGVQVNIGTPNGAQGANNTINVQDMPLEALIEANPRLLSATMHLFDEIDAIYGEMAPDSTQNAQEDVITSPNDPNAPISTPMRALSAQNDVTAAHEAVYDEMEGTWRVIDTNDATNTRNDANDTE